MALKRPPIGLGLHRRAEPAAPSARHVPYAEWEKLTRGRRHPLVGLGSALVHVAVLLLALLTPKAGRQEAKQSPQSQPHIVPMVYFPPPEPPKPPPAEPARPEPPPPPPPTPAFAEAPSRPTTDLPSPGEQDAPEHDEAAASSPAPADRPVSPERRPEATALAEEEDPMVTEAQRLFGPSAPTSQRVAGPVRAGLPLRMMYGGSRCAGGEDVVPVDRPAEGVIEGIVRTESGGHPIPGAFLQILGNGASTFADATGHYRLVFDASLVDACRSQLVRVTAPGYRARTMVLSWGRPSDNTIDLAGKP